MNMRHATPEQERYARTVVEGIIAKSKCDQNGRMYSFLEREWDGQVIKPN